MIGSDRSGQMSQSDGIALPTLNQIRSNQIKDAGPWSKDVFAIHSIFCQSMFGIPLGRCVIIETLISIPWNKTDRLVDRPSQTRARARIPSDLFEMTPCWIETADILVDAVICIFSWISSLVFDGYKCKFRENVTKISVFRQLATHLDYMQGRCLSVHK